MKHSEERGAEKDAQAGDRSKVIFGMEGAVEILALTIEAFDLFLRESKSLDLELDLNLEEVKVDLLLGVELDRGASGGKNVLGQLFRERAARGMLPSDMRPDERRQPGVSETPNTTRVEIALQDGKGHDSVELR